MAAAWSALGSKVTLVSQAGLLDRLPAFAGELVAAGLRDSGVDVKTGARVTGAVRAGGAHHGGDGPVTLTLADGTPVTADEVLSAVGRFPRTAGLGLDTVGLDDGSWLDVDDTMRVTAVDGGWLYAAGDVNHLALLTHMGKYQARICGAVIAARSQGLPVSGPRFSDVADHGIVPQVTFTDPQVASVGLTEAEAREAGVDVETVEYDMGALSGTYVMRDTYTGRAKIVIDTASDTLVGATFVGPEVSDLVHAATIAIVGGVTLERLWHAVPSYPTPSEIWLRLLETRYNPS
jgi:pyruvate/2-oxoglutarate dehydrogenase complex dihydrolipoamide dehydrogenase (E3) component